MTEQTTPAADPYLDFISPEMRENYVDIATSLAAFDEQIATLQRHRRALIDERQAAIDMAVADATDDATIVALRRSGDAGAQRLVDEVRALSPRLYDTIEFSATGTEENFVGPYLSLMEYPTRPLADVDTEALAAVLVEFARRFCPVPPQTGEYAGMVCGDILTDGDVGLTLLYAPDGSEAVLLIGRSREVRGTLADVLTAAIREVKRQRAEDDHDF